jgi:hypothetical protein
MEQNLGHVLGHVEVSVDRIFERAKLEPTNSSAARLLFGGVAILLLVTAGFGLWRLNQKPEPIARQNPPAKPVERPIQEDPEPQSNDSAAARLDATSETPVEPPDRPEEPAPMAPAGNQPWKLVIEAEDLPAAMWPRTIGNWAGISASCGRRARIRPLPNTMCRCRRRVCIAWTCVMRPMTACR